MADLQNGLDLRGLSHFKDEMMQAMESKVGKLYLHHFEFKSPAYRIFISIINDTAEEFTRSRLVDYLMKNKFAVNDASDTIANVAPYFMMVSGGDRFSNSSVYGLALKGTATYTSGNFYIGKMVADSSTPSWVGTELDVVPVTTFVTPVDHVIEIGSVLLGDGVDVSKMEIVKYGIATADEIQAALDAGKMIFCEKDGDRFQYVTLSEGNHIFLGFTGREYSLTTIGCRIADSQWGIMESPVQPLLTSDNAGDGIIINTNSTHPKIESKIFTAIPGRTTFDEIVLAQRAGKTILVLNGVKVGTLLDTVLSESAQHIFLCHEYVSAGRIQTTLLKCARHDSSWSREVLPIAERLVAGDLITIAGNVISASGAVAKVDADDGKCVLYAAMGADGHTTQGAVETSIDNAPDTVALRDNAGCLQASNPVNAKDCVNLEYLNERIQFLNGTNRGNFDTKAALDAYAGEKNPNDYAFVTRDETHLGKAWCYIYTMAGASGAWVASYEIPQRSSDKYFVDIVGDGSRKSFDIQHNLGSSVVLAQCWKSDGANEMVQADFEIVNDNVLRVKFGEALARNAKRRVIVIG